MGIEASISKPSPQQQQKFAPFEIPAGTIISLSPSDETFSHDLRIMTEEGVFSFNGRLQADKKHLSRIYYLLPEGTEIKLVVTR
jgi:hypothetical protein